jgi:hypothetical protein
MKSKKIVQNDEESDQSKMAKEQVDSIKSEYLDSHITVDEQKKKSEITDSDDSSPQFGAVVTKEPKTAESKEQKPADYKENTT